MFYFRPDYSLSRQRDLVYPVYTHKLFCKGRLSIPRDQDPVWVVEVNQKSLTFFC